MERASRRSAAIVVFIFWSLVSPRSETWGMCNTIPVVQEWFPSNIGSVDQPIAAPDQDIHIRLNPACPNQPGRFAGVLRVQFTFEGGQTKDAKNVVIQSPTLLQVTVPTTLDLAKNGLAGPTKVEVTALSGGPLLAQISDLFEPTSACDQEPEKVFQRFTILPVPNDVSTTAGLRATLDGGGDLLIPVDHTSVLPVSTTEALAAFETGKGFFKVAPGGKEAWVAAVETLGKGASRWDMVEVYSIQGRRLPALALFDATGSLFGIADGLLPAQKAGMSVLRFPRTYGKDTLYTLSPPSPGLPIVFANGTSTPDVVLKACKQANKTQAVQLTGLRMSAGVLAYTRADTTPLGIVQIHDADKGGQNCGKSTSQAAATAPSSGLARPYLEVGNNLVAFAQKTSGSAGPPLQVFNAMATPIAPTGSPSPRPVLTPALNGQSLVPSNAFVFFSQLMPSTRTERVFDSKTQSFRLKAESPMLRGVVSNARSAVITQNGGLQFYDAPNDQPQPVTATMVGDVAISPNVLTFTSGASTIGDMAPGWLMVQAVGTPTPLPTPVGVKAAEVAAVDMNVAFITPENAAPPIDPGCRRPPMSVCDLNNDGDATDEVLRIYHVGAAIPSETRMPATDFVVHGRWVAFRSSEAAQGSLDTLCGTTPTGQCDRNGDHDNKDQVMMVHDIATGTTFSTGQAASLCGTDPCTKFGLEWMMPYGIRSRRLYFLTNESEQNEDLNGDGLVTDVEVLQIFDIRSRKKWPLGTLSLPIGPAVLPILQDLPEEELELEEEEEEESFLRVVQQSNPKTLRTFVLGDADEDGTFDAFDSCVTKANPEQLDDDCDGLGDGSDSCDPTYCTDFIPHLNPPRRKGELQLAAKAALLYLATRARATQACLDRFSVQHTLGTFSRDAALVCRGYFVDSIEVFPLERKTADTLRAAAFKLWSTIVNPAQFKRRDLDSLDTSDADALVRRLLPAYGESANAATRAVYGNGLADLSPLAHECQQRLGEASIEYLVRTVAAMQECVHRVGHVADLAARCIGRVRQGHIVLPEDQTAQHALDGAAQAVLAVATRGKCASIDLLNACSADPSRAAECITCINWRRAADVAIATYDPESPDAQTCRPRRVPIPTPASQEAAHHPGAAQHPLAD